MFFSQSPLSVKFRALQHERLVATRAKPDPDRWCQRWICSFSKPCAQRMNAMQKRSEPLSLYKCQCQHYYYCVYLASFTLKFCLQVKNVYQTSFSAFLDSLDLSRSPDFPQVGRVIVLPAVLFEFSSVTVSIGFVFLPAGAFVECLRVWQLLVVLFAAHTCLFLHTWCGGNVYSGVGSF